MKTEIIRVTRYTCNVYLLINGTRQKVNDTPIDFSEAHRLSKAVMEWIRKPGKN